MIQKILCLISSYAKTSAFIFGVVSSLAFPPFYHMFLLVIGLCACWLTADRATAKRQAAAIGYWYGFGFYAAGFYWVGNALLIDARTFGWLYPVTLLSAGAFFGLFTILPFVCRTCAVGALRRTTVFAAVWVLMEWLRSFILTGFPWNLLGTVLAFRPEMLQTAALWGTYGLSFLVLIWIGLIYQLFERFERKNALIVCLLPLLLFGYGSWRYRPTENADSSPLTVRLVQPAIAQKMKWNRSMLEENLRRYVDLSQGKKVDFVIWGETAVPFDPADDDDYRTLIASAAPTDGYLLTGVLRREADTFYNSLYILNAQGEILDFYDKHHLVPFGEYIPFRRFLPTWIKPVANQVSDLGIGQPYKALKIGKYPVFGALICYEIIFPDAVVNRADKPQWLVVVSNDGWYGNSAGPYQHLVATQMRAIEEGITIVRSANTGISAVINSRGQILDSVGLSQSGKIDVRLPQTLAEETLYAKIGERGVVLALILILGGAPWPLCRRKRDLVNPLALGEVRRFCETEIFKQPLTALREITRGGNSFNYCAQTADKTYFIKLLKATRYEHFKRLSKILDFVGRYPDFYTAHEAFHTEKELSGYKILITDFMEGHKLRYRHLTPEVMQSIIRNYRAFCRMPLAKEDFVLPLRSAHELYESNRQCLLAQAQTEKGLRRRLLMRLLSFNESIYRQTPPTPTPTSVIHGDASLNNLLINSQQHAAILDLELIRKGHPVEDAVEFILSALLPHYVLSIPFRRMAALIRAVNEHTDWSPDIWQYGVCIHFLYALHRRLNGSKLFSSCRKTWLFVRYLNKFEPILTTLPIILKK